MLENKLLEVTDQKTIDAIKATLPANKLRAYDATLNAAERLLSRWTPCAAAVTFVLMVLASIQGTPLRYIADDFSSYTMLMAFFGAIAWFFLALSRTAFSTRDVIERYLDTGNVNAASEEHAKATEQSIQAKLPAAKKQLIQIGYWSSLALLLGCMVNAVLLALLAIAGNYSYWNMGGVLLWVFVSVVAMSAFSHWMPKKTA